MTILDNCRQSISFLLFFVAKHCFVYGCLTKNTQSFINFVATIDQVSQVLRIGLCSSFVEVLHNISSELVFADFEWVLGEGSRSWLGTKSDKVARRG